ncbi:hypothetical protein [Kitasatospora cheerisanensis]|uniref:hypothetical protein n=1 Tax=Kitasatospora cheerisanensis TaxID=81942 RepID=UPI000565491F|nr:hypothetical protein [Kitasatospora cheerisanensis]
MSRPESEPVTAEQTGAEDRPAIGAARLEAMFDGLRREVVLAVPVPASAELARRGAARRRRRAGVVAGAAALGVAVLWSAVTVLPGPVGHGVAGYPVQPTAAAGKPTGDVPLPVPLPEPQLPSVAGAPVWAPLDSADPAVKALALDVARLPSLQGGYGPWKAVPSADRSADQEATPGPSGSASPETAVSAGPSQSSNSAAGSGPSQPGRSGEPSGSGPPADPFADGCVSRLVQTSGALQMWGQRYVDAWHVEASAQQFVLRFGSPLAAENQASRLLAGGECVSSGAGWKVEQQIGALVGLAVRQPVAYAEEVAVHLTGTTLAVMTVRRGGPGATPAVGLSDSFLASASQFLLLPSSGPSSG